ncbi:MAG: sterol desaturase family protein [Acidimicrobiia bacterium]|jgi:sterol desaturase/sphingolipid hydroxylase (fatty acid hydroxylase superfamily)
MIVLTLLLALAVALAVRGPEVLVGLVVLAALFVPLERLFALRRQKVLRPGLCTDLTHFLLNTMIVTVLTVAFVAAGALPLIWLRAIDVESFLPGVVAVPLAVLFVLVGQYWGHRMTHQVPWLWRFHAVHHSIERMDWVASARLHPVDQAFTQAFTVMPLFLLGYGQVAVVGVGAAVALLALFQHANVRVRFPGLRWLVNTPEWHHWHHAVDASARDKNFGVPLVDLCFGTAYLPNGSRPTGFGTDDPVPPDGYLRHLAYPFRRRGVAPAPSVPAALDLI